MVSHHKHAPTEEQKRRHDQLRCSGFAPVGAPPSRALDPPQSKRADPISGGTLEPASAHASLCVKRACNEDVETAMRAYRSAFECFRVCGSAYPRPSPRRPCSSSCVASGVAVAVRSSSSSSSSRRSSSPLLPPQRSRDKCLARPRWQLGGFYFFFFFVLVAWQATPAYDECDGGLLTRALSQRYVPREHACLEPLPTCYVRD